MCLSVESTRPDSSGQFDEENPIVLISSGLLVQSDEGVSDLVVDRIDVTTAINREAPGVLTVPGSNLNLPLRPGSGIRIRRCANRYCMWDGWVLQVNQLDRVLNTHRSAQLTMLISAHITQLTMVEIAHDARVSTLKQMDTPVREYIRKFENGCYFVPLIGRDVEEKLRHFVDGLRPTLKHDVRLTEPKDFRSAVDKALRAEQDWKEIEEERHQKRQAFQLKNQRQSKLSSPVDEQCIDEGFKKVSVEHSEGDKVTRSDQLRASAQVTVSGTVHVTWIISTSRAQLTLLSSAHADQIRSRTSTIVHSPPLLNFDSFNCVWSYPVQFRCCSRALLYHSVAYRMRGRAEIPHSHLPPGFS
ncbi:hypothetical protein F511_26276 [Dorcoceras hygrometricum]|uniref:Uncharacterized protein n=1 Tax=Dorcoceras hygrometricum TaxID=472368 RepID=A0A2Z7CA50_9LAMI|nr:hypothetical protein F511_26276 [Dorcoceras hygrometricum]